MLLSHPAHHDPLLRFPAMTLPIPCCYSREVFLSLAVNFKVYTPALHSPLFSILHHLSGVQSILPLNFFPPCFVSSGLLTPIFFAASSPALHLSSRESSYLRDIKGRSAFLSHCGSRAYFTPRPNTLKTGSSLMHRTLSGAASLDFSKNAWGKVSHDGIHRQNVGNVYIPGGK